MFIDIHGLVIKTHCQSDELLAQMLRPFKYFIKDSGLPAVEVFVQATEPPYDSFPRLKASFSTPRNIVFKGIGIKIIDYFGKGVVVEENKGQKFTIYGTDPNFLQEAFHFLVMSRFGQYCDQKGLFRIHALVISYNDIAIIISALPGGGKSTLALSLLNAGKFKLISDDQAVLDKSGRILPLPLRIGTPDEDKAASIPEEYIYDVDRAEYGRKYFVDVDYWRNKIDERSHSSNLFFSVHRLLKGDPYIEKASRLETIGNLMGTAVFGFGLYQGIEFLFDGTPRGLFIKLPVYVRRMISALNFSLGSGRYKIYLSRDSAMNINVLEEFIRNYGHI